MIDNDLKYLVEKCEYLLTQEQMDHIRDAMANYALAALIDPSVAKEAEKIALASVDHY